MTLPASGAISTAMILAELQTVNTGRGAPLSLTDSDVRSLAGKPSGTVTMPADFYGKSAGGTAPPAPPPLTVQTTNGQSSALTPNEAGSVACTVSASASGGTGAITHQWEFISNPGQFVLSNSNAATATVSKAYVKYSSGSYRAILRDTVRDAAGAVVVAEPVYADLDWNASGE